MNSASAASAKLLIRCAGMAILTVQSPRLGAGLVRCKMREPRRKFDSAAMFLHASGGGCRQRRPERMKHSQPADSSVAEGLHPGKRGRAVERVVGWTEQVRFPDYLLATSDDVDQSLTPPVIEVTVHRTNEVVESVGVFALRPDDFQSGVPLRHQRWLAE